MDSAVSGTHLTCREAACALSSVLLRTEPKVSGSMIGESIAEVISCTLVNNGEECKYYVTFTPRILAVNHYFLSH